MKKSYKQFDLVIEIWLNDMMASQKEQFHEKGQIYQASELLFDIPSPQVLGNYSVVECNNFVAYNAADGRDPAQ